MMMARPALGSQFGTAAMTVVTLVFCSSAFCQCDTWQPIGDGLLGSVDALTTFDGDLIGGGDSGNTTGYVARWDGSAWRPLGGGFNGRVWALASFHDELVAGGEFTLASGLRATGVARWDGRNWRSLGDGLYAPNYDATAFALAQYGDELVVGGYFLTAGGVTAYGIAAWNGATWHDLGGGLGPAPYGGVSGLAVFDDELIAGGWFTSAGDQSANFIARWNGSTWQPLGSGIGSGGGCTNVWAMAAFGDQLIVGGQFTTAGGIGANNIARWDGREWHAMDNGLGDYCGPFFSAVIALRTYNGRLYAGGWFDPGNIARWNGATWDDVGSMAWSSPFGSPGVASLTVHDSSLVAGGSFDLAGGQVIHNIATRIDCPKCSADIAPLGGNGTIDHEDLLAVLAAWGPCSSCPPTCAADINADCMVNSADLLAVINGWGPCP